MTAKQRGYLKSLAMKMEPIYQIGKSTLTPELTQGVSEALEARELIKINVLKNCMADVSEVAQVISERTQSEVVQVIGRKIVLYRESEDKKKIVLPKEKK
ncbi:MAG: ribosome assembly RNA-binding protein YhbY [Clostridiales bacterium]|nr:ribosome assembly RNA-binding protein YhbY [Clostridiales bacterium]